MGNKRMNVRIKAGEKSSVFNSALAHTILKEAHLSGKKLLPR